MPSAFIRFFSAGSINVILALLLFSCLLTGLVPLATTASQRTGTPKAVPSAAQRATM
jgi:hypothetical protein